MSILTDPTTPPATPGAWHHQVGAADRPHVTHLPAPIPPGDCTWCPPGDPARPATAQLLTIRPGGGLDSGVRTELVGDCCLLDAIHHRVADGHITVVQPAGETA